MNPTEVLVKIAIQLRTLHLFYHHCHHIVARIAFFGDHEAFNDFYNHVSKDYDDVAERIIGLTDVKMLNLPMILTSSLEKLKMMSSDVKENKDLFIISLKFEQELQSLGTIYCKLPESSEGCKQMVGNILDESEKRIYKIKQRSK